jgi:hypothetical protein
MTHLIEAAERCLGRPWVSYVAVFLVQLKVVWGAWMYRDLGAGDTGAYFAFAQLWLRHWKVNFAWSPLYTAFYGSLLGVTPDDAYLPTVAHRLLIVFGVTLLVLALMRRLLTPGLALLVALWWAVLPVTFETMYEVHLFGTLPLLACWLVILGGPAWRGAALAILAAGAVLVRNELGLTVLILAAFCLAAEVRARRAAVGTSRSLLLVYGLPLLLAAILCAGAYWRSEIKLARWRDASSKHTLNMCQVYAFGYKQRHPEWERNPWTGCSALMQEHFGRPMPAFGEMLRANPRAMATHFAWNAGLTGNGLQLVLFDATSGAVSPDYQPVKTGSTLAAALSAVAVVALVAGAVVIARGPRAGLDRWLAARAWGWLAIAAMVPAWVAIILTQRPRSSYLLPLGAALMAAIATSVRITVWPTLTRLLGRAGPWALAALVVGLLVWLPPHYRPDGRPLLALYRRHLPFASLIARPQTVLLTSGYALELNYYLGRGKAQVLDYGSVGALGDGRSTQAALDGAGINLFYADEAMLDRLESSRGLEPLLDSLQTADWTLVGGENHEGARWRMWRRRAAAAHAAP